MPARNTPQRPTVMSDTAARSISAQLPGGATNYSVGYMRNNDIIISKVNGVTSRAQAIRNLIPYIRRNKLHEGRTIYLAQKFNTSVGSNHAEMCLIAAAKELGSKLVKIYCSGPHCGFCGAVMSKASITLGNSKGNDQQMGWTHPYVPLNYGQQLASTTQNQLRELKGLPLVPKQSQIVYGKWGLTKPKGKYRELSI